MNKPAVGFTTSGGADAGRDFLRNVPCAVEARSVKDRTTELRSCQVGVPEICQGQVGAFQDRVRQGRAVEDGLPRDGSTQRRAGEIRLIQVCARDVYGLSETVAEVRAGQIATLQVRTLKVSGMTEPVSEELLELALLLCPAKERGDHSQRLLLVRRAAAPLLGVPIEEPAKQDRGGEPLDLVSSSERVDRLRERLAHDGQPVGPCPVVEVLEDPEDRGGKPAD